MRVGGTQDTWSGKASQQKRQLSRVNQEEAKDAQETLCTGGLEETKCYSLEPKDIWSS